jgi:hypothetical protein
MCKQCVEMVEKYFPDCPKKEYGNFLMSATAFPFGDPDYIGTQLKQARDAGCKTYEEAIVFANNQLEESMKRLERE